MSDIYSLIKCWLGLHDWHIRHETDYEYKGGWLIGFTKYVKRSVYVAVRLSAKIKRNIVRLLILEKGTSRAWIYTK